MGYEINNTNIELIISSTDRTDKEYGFRKVLDDFENAEWIYVVTFNISTAKDSKYLLSKLRKNEKAKEIILVSNIPREFNDNSNYDKEFYSFFELEKEAKKPWLINLYNNELDPKNFNSNFKSYFCLNNHSKFIMTNNIAYIGSANYSDKSINSIEAGIIIRDKNEIEKIKKYIKQKIIDENSLDYDSFNKESHLLDKFQNKLKEQNIFERLEKIYLNIEIEDVWDIDYGTGEEFTCIMYTPSELLETKELVGTIYAIEDLTSHIENVKIFKKITGCKYIFEVNSVLKMVEAFSRDIISAEMKFSKMNLIKKLGIHRHDEEIAKYDEWDLYEQISHASYTANKEEYSMRCKMAKYICKVYKELINISIYE